MPIASISSILCFEEQWLKSNNVTRINNQKLYLPVDKHVSEGDINEALDIFKMRNISTTKEEVKALMTEGATLASIEMWFSSGILPRSPLLKRFIANKGIR